MIVPNELTLDDKAQRCLSIAYLRMLDLDIAASPRKERESKLSDRAAYVKVLGSLLPPSSRTYSSVLHGEIGELLRISCAETTTEAHRAMILSEIAVLQPWTGTKMFSQLRVNDESKLIALKELAAYFLIPGGDKHVDHVMEEIVPGPRNLKKIAVVTLASVAGGLVAAPHIGAAIGVYAMGLSGAAATSAGLAALGFGATAAGGFGMAGGTLLIGALGGAAGGAASIASSSSKVKSSAMVEALKLNITLYLMLQLPEAMGTARRTIAQLKYRISNCETALKLEKSSESKDRKRVKEIESEIKILKAAIPDAQ